MNPDINHPILSVPIHDLLASEAFKRMAKQNNFNTLRQIVTSDMNKFAHHPGSDYRILRELLNILDQNGLINLVREPLP